jgi:uncharacterized membrane protein
MSVALFSVDGIDFIMRWFHFMFGITWIGLLYYFNFVQGEFFKEIEAGVKNVAISKLVPRALGWFRYAALGTFLTGVAMLGIKGHTGGIELFQTSWGVFILLGTIIATTMFLNVWLIIWPNQKVVIASTEQVLSGGKALENAAAAGGKALLASRTNVMFSVPMLFFMGAASHLPIDITPASNLGLIFLVCLSVVALLEVNAIKGKLGPLTTIKGVVHCGLGLAAVLYALIEVLA